MAGGKINLIILYISSLMSVVVGIATSVLNTSSLSVTDYGDVRYVNNFMNFFASILLFGFFVSGARVLALTKEEDRRREINGALIVALFATMILMFVCIWGCYFIHKHWIDPQHAYLFLKSLPVCVAPLLLNYVNNTFQGENRIITLSIARCIPSVLYLVIAYWIYKTISATSILVLLLQNGIICLVLLSCIVCVRPSFKNLSRSFRLLIEENKRYGIHVYIGSIFAVSFSYLAGVSLGAFSDNNTNVGFFTLATTLTSPLSMLPAIVGTSYFRDFAFQNKIPGKILMFTIEISLSSLLGFVLLISPIVDLLYDSSYSEVASISVFLAFAATVHGLGDMFNRFLGAHGKGKELRNGAFVCGGVMLIGNIVCVYFWGIEGAIATRIFSSLSYFAFMLYYYYIFKLKIEISNLRSY